MLAVFCTELFLGSFCHKAIFTFFESTQNYEFFDAHHDLFWTKKIRTLVRVGVDFYSCAWERIL